MNYPNGEVILIVADSHIAGGIFTISGQLRPMYKKHLLI